MNKVIYLARHAKSAWDSGAATDFERPLSARGERDAKKMGDALSRRGWKPELIIASPAIRAKQTCKILCQSLSIPIGSVVWNKDIYAAYMVTLLHILSTQAESLTRVMLVGHNPAMEDLLQHLCPEARDYQQKNGKLFTTGNVAKIALHSNWQGLALCEAQLEKILRPKTL